MVFIIGIHNSCNFSLLSEYMLFGCIYNLHITLSIASTRNFSIEQMKKVITDPDYSRKSFNGRIISEKTFGNIKLEVVYIIIENTYLIITVYFK